MFITIFIHKLQVIYMGTERIQTKPITPSYLIIFPNITFSLLFRERDRNPIHFLGKLLNTLNMVGIFSKFSVSRNGHRRTQSALDEREVVPPNAEATSAATVDGDVSAVTHGIEVAVEFKPVEHPTEPLDNDLPIQCPLPEPSILNDGRIWKERVSVGAQSGSADLAITQQEGEGPTEPEPAGTKPRPPSNRRILPSVSAPEHNILKLLEECNASGL